MQTISSTESAELELVRRVLLSKLQDASVRVYLFGSRATGKPRSFSDVDIGIAHDGRLFPDQFSALREALDDLNVLLEIDLVDLHQVSPAFRERVMREGVQWID